MRNRRRILSLLAVALAAVALYAVFRGPAEPSYQGRSLSGWLDRCPPGDLLPDPGEREKSPGRPLYDETAEAVRQIGTNALPTILSWWCYEMPPWQQKLNRLFETAGLSWRIGDYKRMRVRKAAAVFQILGPRAKAAIPELTRLINDPTNDACALRSTRALALLGEGAIPPLVSTLTNQTCAREVRFYVAHNIASLGTNARPLLPILIQALQDQEMPIRSAAANWLGQLRLEPGLVVPALATTLQDSDASIRRNAALALGNFRSHARSATPALLKILTDPDVQVRKQATNALLKIAPEVLTNAPPATATPTP